MIKANSNYKYRVKYVKHRRYQDGNITSFSIGDKIKDGDGYQNWTITIWDYVDIDDGDSVLIKSIDSVSAVLYNGKVYQNMTATVTVAEAQRQAFAEEAPPPVQQYKKPESAAPTQSQGFLDDPDAKIPFDV